MGSIAKTLLSFRRRLCNIIYMRVSAKFYIKIRVSKASVDTMSWEIAQIKKRLNDFLGYGDETQRSVETSFEHTSSHQVAHRNGLHNGMNTFFICAICGTKMKKRLLTTEAYQEKRGIL